ncbi:hypothetical protein AEYBE204_07430 [Asticcacaulis sp. YBE204]|nr:hypothetical protein AEYBE204_07430 [Asticcacaulis sp. YBE204]
MVLSESPAALWLRHAIAWLLGAVMAVALVRMPQRLWSGWPLIAAAMIALSFGHPGSMGVHRWVGMGPVQFNAAALVLPLTVVVLGRQAQLRWWIIGMTAAIGLMLFIQPDASMFSALAVALMIAVTLSGRPTFVKTIAVFALGVLIWAVWQRHDPLRPVAEVEGIVSLAAGHSVWLAAAIVAAVALTCAVPGGIALKNPDLRRSGLMLSAFLSVMSVSAAIGVFPVPLAGYGLSYVLGLWVAIAAFLAPDDTK